jgi:hypothetical protein
VSAPPAVNDSTTVLATALEVDPDRSNIILCVGTKGSGKSEAARLIFDQWPYDRLALDVTGDARPDDPATIVLTAPFGAQMPEPDREADPPQTRVTVWARVDPRSATYVEDQDDALNLVVYPRHNSALAWVDEYGELATQAKMLGNTKLLIQSSRHYHATLLLCCPRPRFIPTLTISQADKILIYDTPNRVDREVLADNMGYPRAKFEQHYADTMRRGRHTFLLWDKRQKVLLGCPPLPIDTGHGPRS